MAALTRRTRLLRLACACLAYGSAEDRDALGSRLRALTADDWFELLLAVNEELLGPAMWAALDRASLVSLVPEDVADYLSYLHAANELRAARMADQLRETVGALNRAGVVPVVLKGAICLVEERTGRDGRMIADLDLLVREPDIPATCRTLADIGYGRLRDYPGHAQEVADFARDGDPSAIDLHKDMIAFGRHFGHVDGRRPLGGEEVLAHARTLSWRGTTLRVPTVSHQILHLILHDQLHDRDYFDGRVNLRHLLDTAQLTHKVDRDEFRSIAARLSRDGLGAATGAYLLAAEDLFGAVFPDNLRPGVWTRLLHDRRMARLGEAPDRLTLLWGALAWEMVGVRYPETSGPGKVFVLFLWRLRKIARALQAVTASPTGSETPSDIRGQRRM